MYVCVYIYNTHKKVCVCIYLLMTFLALKSVQVSPLTNQLIFFIKGHINRCDTHTHIYIFVYNAYYWQ